MILRWKVLRHSRAPRWCWREHGIVIVVDVTEERIIVAVFDSGEDVCDFAYTSTILTVCRERTSLRLRSVREVSILGHWLSRIPITETIGRTTAGLRRCQRRMSRTVRLITTSPRHIVFLVI